MSPPAVSEAAKLEQVIRWILEANSPAMVAESIEGNWPGVVAQPLIDAANAEIEKQGGWDIAAARLVYTKQMEIGEFADAARSLKEIERLKRAANKPADTTPTLFSNPSHRTSDLNSVNRALKNGWNIPQEVMDALPLVMASVMASGDHRAKVAAGRVLVSMHAQNQKEKPVRPRTVKHIHTLEPVTEHNIDERRRILDARLASISQDAGGDGAG